MLEVCCFSLWSSALVRLKVPGILRIEGVRSRLSSLLFRGHIEYDLVPASYLDIWKSCLESRSSSVLASGLVRVWLEVSKRSDVFDLDIADVLSIPIGHKEGTGFLFFFLGLLWCLASVARFELLGDLEEEIEEPRAGNCLAFLLRGITSGKWVLSPVLLSWRWGERLLVWGRSKASNEFWTWTLEVCFRRKLLFLRRACIYLK